MPVPKIIGNWKVVALSFAGATTFWFFSALGKDYNFRVQFPVAFEYDRDSLVAVKPLPKYVDLDVSGGGWDLFRESFWFGSDPIIFELDNPATTRYLTRATILPTVTDQLGQYRINFLFTDTLHLDIDQKISRKVNLNVDSTAISMDEDYRIISNITLAPDTATIFGPSSFIDTLGGSFDVVLQSESIDRSFNRFVKLGLPEGWDIYSDPPTVNVQFEVDRFDQLEMVTHVEVQNFPEDSSVYISNPEIKLRFVVQQSLREEYFSEDFNVIVDYNLINPADSAAPAILIFQPEHVLEVETIPDSLTVTYAQ